MGRAYEVRKASIQKTGAAKAKLYSTYAKEIYIAAKKGTPELESNINLKRVVEKAKKEQVPNDIINRAIDKAKGNTGEDYQEVIYEGFGPGSSTFIIKTLTDNVNRTVSFVRAAFNKVNKSLGVTNSVSYNYDYLAIISFESDKEEELFDGILSEGIELVDFENDNNLITITANPSDIHKVKDIVERIVPNVDYKYDEVGMYPKEYITLDGEDKELYDRLYNLLDEIDDVTAIYTNVK